MERRKGGQDRLKPRGNALAVEAAVILALCAANIAWFGTLALRGAIKGDDIGYVLEGRAMRSLADILAFNGYKYRPVVSLLEWLETRLCGNSYEAYLALNLGVQCLVTALLYRTAPRVSGRRSTAIFLSALFVVCPFAYYNVTQVFGMMEAVCLVLLLLIARSGFSFFKTGKLSRFLETLFFCLLIVFTHERFLALLPVVLAAVALCASLSRRRKLAYAALALVPFALNVAVKMLVGATLMIGTAYKPISISAASVAGFFWQGLMSILGVNNGPSYHSGYALSQYTPLEQWFAWAMLGVSALSLALCIVRLLLEKDREKRVYGLKCALLGAMAIGATLLSACVTIYVESRWLLAPYLCVLLLLAFCLRKTGRFPLGPLAALAMLVLSCTINVHYRGELSQLYFIRGMEQAGTALEATVGRYGKNLADYELAIVTDDDSLIWALGEPGNSLFDVYLEDSPKWRYASVDEGIEPLGPVKVFKTDENSGLIEVEEITGWRLLYDINAWQDRHIVIPDTEADTPTGKGAFFFNGNLTVTSGYRDRLDGLNIPEGAILMLSASLPYAGSDGARVTVYLVVDGGMTSICTIDLEPQHTFTQYYPIENDMNNAGLTIGVMSPTGKQDADWVVFSDLRVLVREDDE